MDTLQVFGAAVISTLVGAVGYLFRMMQTQGDAIAALREKLGECERNHATVQAQLVAIQAAGDQSQFDTDSIIDAEVVINALSGMIVEWSPGATMMLGWTRREILGKPVARLIPARYREAHAAKVAALIQSNRLPERGPITGYATTKLGNEVPVEIYLRGWRETGQAFLGATLKRRNEDDGDSSDSNSVPTSGAT